MTKEQFEAYQFSTIEYDEVALGLEDAIKEGIEQGMEKGMEIKEKEMTIKGIEKALLRKKMTISEIAENFEVSIQFVVEIQDRLINLKILK